MGGAASWPAATAHPPDDIVVEVFLRLPPHPVCLLHVSLVCKHWCRLIREQSFLRRLSARHHHVAPLLGFFHQEGFVPTGNAPDRLAAAHFSQLQGSGWRVLSSCHGRVLLQNSSSLQSEAQLLVWDPMTGGRSYLPIHPKYRRHKFYHPIVFHAAILCGDSGGQDHHTSGDGCGLRPFTIVFLFTIRGRVQAGVYSSQTQVWGKLVSMGIPRELVSIKEMKSVFICNALYLLWPCNYKIKIVGFHLCTNSLFVEDFPVDTLGTYDCYQIVKACDGELGVAAVRGSHLHVFVLTNTKGSTMWVEYRSAQLHDLHSSLPLFDSDMYMYRPLYFTLGYDEEGNCIFLQTSSGVFALQLESMEVNKVLDGKCSTVLRSWAMPYMRFYIPGANSDEDVAND